MVSVPMAAMERATGTIVRGGELAREGTGQMDNLRIDCYYRADPLLVRNSRGLLWYYFGTNLEPSTGQITH